MIAANLEARAGRTVSRGHLYTSLDRLEDKGLLRWKVAAGTPERGDLPRRLYSVTPAGVAALREAGEDSRRFRAIFDERRRAMIAGLRSIGFGVGAEPTGAFYVLANARHLSSDSVSLAYEILDATHVAVTPGAAFGANAEGYLRFSYASSVERIQQGLDRIARFLSTRR